MPRFRGLAACICMSTAAGWRTLVVVEATGHARHRPPPGVVHVEVPERVEAAAEALRASEFSDAISWRAAVDAEVTAEGAVEALKRVHTVRHLREVARLSGDGGGGFDTDTYVAPGSWEASLDATRAWITAVGLAAGGDGPALALSRPAGHHATRDAAMGFGLVNFAATAAAAHLASGDETTVAVLDWDVHYGNGVASILGDAHPRARYCSVHEEGGFPGTGGDMSDRGPLGNLLNVPLPKGAGSTEFQAALRDTALPFLLSGAGGPPDVLLVCAGYDALAGDPLASMTLKPTDFGDAVRMVAGDFGFPPERVAVGLEGGYDLDRLTGMPAGLVDTCRALCEEEE